MPEEIVQGHSLEEIRQDWEAKLELRPEDLTLEVIEKPGIFLRQWKVRLIWNDQCQVPVLTPSHVIWDGTKYLISLGEGVKLFRPCMRVGEVWFKGKLQDKPFSVSFEDQVEFHPKVSLEQLTWELQVRLLGLSVVAKVRHELPGHYILAKDLPALEEIDLSRYVTWENLPLQGEVWDEARLQVDLAKLKVVHGLRSGVWQEILAIEGLDEVVVAEATLPVPPIHAQVVDFVGAPQRVSETGEESVDFFASKVRLVEEGTVLARKIPGTPGVPGKDVHGKVLSTEAVKDFQFNLKKNVYLSDDGLEVVAACAGQPVRQDERTYMVEIVYVLNKDVDLETGSIEFPGDVYVNGNVQEGLHIFAGGKVEIRGTVSHAEIRAEKGAKIQQNLLGGTIIVGGKFKVHSELLRSVAEFQDQLTSCLGRTAELIKSPGAINLKPGLCLKAILEKQFPELAKLSQRLEKFVLEHKQDEMVTESLMVAVRTAKKCLAGLGPLEPQSLPLLLRANQALQQFLENSSLEVPEKVSFAVSYVQGATIECGGSFECQKGTYNSNIRVEGDVIIDGVCRGGKIIAEGKVSIRELGGSGLSATFVQISSDSRLSVNYCHSNVIVAVEKEIIQIEEAYKKLEIYRETGRTQVERIRANPN